MNAPDAATIAALNDDLIWRMQAGQSIWDALEDVELGWDLVLIIESGNTRLYKIVGLLAHGTYVNYWAWADGRMDSSVGEGGLGFDDQLHIWEDEG